MSDATLMNYDPNKPLKPELVKFCEDADNAGRRGLGIEYQLQVLHTIIEGTVWLLGKLIEERDAALAEKQRGG